MAVTLDDRRGAGDSHDAVEHYGPLQAIPAAVRETWKQTRSTLSLIGSMVTGAVSTKNLSSVISIARRQCLGTWAWPGSCRSWRYLAEPGILNLLPIPILDGGHLVYYLSSWSRAAP